MTAFHPDLPRGQRTNNHVESWNGGFKNSTLQRKVPPTVHALVAALFEKELPRIFTDRALKATGAPGLRQGDCLPCTWHTTKAEVQVLVAGLLSTEKSS